jgi:four helix bundle protein
MKKENVIRDKSYNFALRIIKLNQWMVNDSKEYVLSKQILKSGTSIGANIEEAIGGQSKKDFRAKMFISYKEARETHYWLRLLKDSELIPLKIANSLLKDCEELKKILSSILLTLNKTNS